MTPSTCGVCIGDIGRPIHYEPIGRDDALIPVCHRCSTESVVPKDDKPLAFRREPTNERGWKIREHRDNLVRQGLCSDGAAHGALVPGTRHCQPCLDKRRARDRSRPR